VRKLLLLLPVPLLLGGTLVWANQPDQPALTTGVVADRLVVDKGERVLLLMRDSSVLKRYYVSLGGNPEGHKQQEGDERTPEGEYIIDRRKEDSSFYRALHISYPDSEDAAGARERGVSPGGDIMIHGIRNGLGWVGKLQRSLNWTNGCVAVTNWEMDELWRAVPEGTPIEIRP
jgi:murein L,D-transpeptidase YafK